MAAKGLVTALAGVAATLFALGVERDSAGMWAPSLLVLVLEGVVGAVYVRRRVANVGGEGGVALGVPMPDNEV